MTELLPLPKILVVDDEEAVCSVLQFFLRKDFEVDLESDWKKAKEKIETQSYDIILTDLMMPGAPQNQIITTTIAVNPQIPVVVMSGLSENDAMVKSALMAGAKLMLPKPFVDRLAVVSALKTFLK